MPPPLISKLRNRRLAGDSALLMRIHEVTGIGMAELGSRLIPFAMTHTLELNREVPVEKNG